jgi:D-sedoheptulose 7-phosphate isomerase
MRDPFESARDLLIACYKNGGKVLVCGNGGSSADSGHIVGELVKGFLKRRPLPEKWQKELSMTFRWGFRRSI